MQGDQKREEAVKLLQQKAQELQRMPKRDDFDSETVCFIKQKLGPWPRALEAAGLKTPPAVTSKEKSRLKRERRKKEIKRIKALQQKMNKRSNQYEK